MKLPAWQLSTQSEVTHWVASPLALGSWAGNQRFLQAVFFISGFVSLAYQVAWQRVLTQAIGLDAYSVTLIVSIFMLGLGLGGLSGAAVVRGGGNLVAIYGGAEAVLGLFGLFSVELIRGANVALTRLAGGFTAEFVVNFALLLIPTLLMGLTLPLVVQLVRHRYPPGAALGAMYSANIIGAAAGALAAGFVLIGTLGIAATCRIMAGTNLAIAVAVLSLAAPRAVAGVKIERATLSYAVTRFRILVTASFLAGLVALGYEIALFRIFTAYFGVVSYVFPLLLCSYLLCMAVGNNLLGRASERFAPSFLSSLLSTLAVSSTILVLIGPAIMLWLGFNQERLEIEPFQTIDQFARMVRILGISLLLMLPVLFISGFFPVLVRAITRVNESLGNNVGVLYFTQTMGNTAGVLLTGLVLLPAVGTIWTLRILGGILLIIPFLVYAAGSLLERTTLGRHVLLALLGIAFIALYPGNFYSYVRDSYDAKRFALGAPLAPAIVREDAQGVTLAYPIPEGYFVHVGRERSTPLFTRAVAFETWPLEFVGALTRSAKHALIVGIGPGTHLPILQRMYPRIQIDVVELNPSLIAIMRSSAAPEILERMKGSHVYVTDGRRFVSNHPRNRYDIIQVGLNHAESAGAGNVYTREFIAQLRTMLTPDGVLTLSAYSAAVRGLLDVFPNVVVASTGDHSNADSVAAKYDAVGSGTRVAHVIAWNNDDVGEFRKRLLHESPRFPGILPANPARPIPDARPNWEAGCLIFAQDARRLLARVRPATDDLPVTEYFLNQYQAVTVLANQDSRVWGSPSSCVPLKSLVQR